MTEKYCARPTASLPATNKVIFVSAVGLVGFLFCVTTLVANAIIIQLYFFE